MMVNGLLRMLPKERMRILIERTPLIITYPTVPKREIIPEVIERKVMGVKSKETQRKSSSSSPTIKTQTSKKTTSSPTTSTQTTPTSSTPTVVTRPPTTYSKYKPYAY